LSLKANNGNSRPTDSISWVFVALNTGIDHCGLIVATWSRNLMRA
jgi:hypothetical protein